MYSHWLYLFVVSSCWSPGVCFCPAWLPTMPPPTPLPALLSAMERYPAVWEQVTYTHTHAHTHTHTHTHIHTHILLQCSQLNSYNHEQCFFIIIHISHILSLHLSTPSGERVFPPASGLTYSSWFCVERFSSAPHLHPLRLLTVVRRASASEQHYVCLSITLSPSDRSLSVSTKEELLHSYCESDGGGGGVT